MAETPRHNDQPITQPADDLYGFDPFAKAIADGIGKMPAPNGYVLAINGPWGAGKSSVINLVLHHLADETAGGSIKIVRFTPWWFRGEEALALAFFRELQGALKPSLGEQAKKLLPKIGARLLRGGGLVGSIINLAAGTGGEVAANAMAYLEGLIETDDSLEALHQELRTALDKQPNRFLVVIDDIDRLTPDEALLIFKLVKSVGQLPNVLYLLAYDRALAERIVADRYPSEGPHFLDKIVQAVFEVPNPSAIALEEQLRTLIAEIFDSAFNDNWFEFLNNFSDVVMPELIKPRDLIRLANTITFSWPTVAGEVNAGDFLALETLRVFDPQLYSVIRTNKALVCGLSGHHQLLDEPREAYDRTFLKNCSVDRIERRKIILRRLFPPVSYAWDNAGYGDDFRRIWARDRRACSRSHFDTYFRLAPNVDVLPKRDLDVLLSRLEDRPFIEFYLREATKERSANGSTKASLVLDELILHADAIPYQSIGGLISTIFLLGEELDVAEDDITAFGYDDSERRRHRLVMALVSDRFDIQERSALLLTCARQAALSTLVHFAVRARGEHQHDERNQSLSPEKRLMTPTDVEACRQITLERLKLAASSGELIEKRQLVSLLYGWSNLADDNGLAAKSWADAQLGDDNSILKFAVEFMTVGWPKSGEELASIKKRSVNTRALTDLINGMRFRERCEELESRSDLSPDRKELLIGFLEAWRRTEADPDC